MCKYIVDINRQYIHACVVDILYIFVCRFHFLPDGISPAIQILYQEYSKNIFQIYPHLPNIHPNIFKIYKIYANYQAVARPGPWRFGAGPAGAAPPPLGMLYTSCVSWIYVDIFLIYFWYIVWYLFWYIF